MKSYTPLINPDMIDVPTGTRVKISAAPTRYDGLEGTIVRSGRYNTSRPHGAVWWEVQVDGDEKPAMFDSTQLERK